MTAKPLVWGEGPKPCDLMLIGEAPGANEVEQERPFVGKAGKVLEEALANAGVSREVVFITNAYKHRPPGNRNPHEEELAAHLDHLRKEFREVQPKRILLLGKVAQQHIAPLARRGSWWISPGNIEVLYTWHPAATLYNPETKEDFFEHVSKFIQGRGNQDEK